MSRGLRLGGRVFVPSAGFTVVALLLCALCVRLGTWQWHKGMQREQEWTRFARGADQVIALGARAVSDVPLFQRVSVTGRLESARQFLLDNRTYRGRAGYEVLTPLARAGAAAAPRLRHPVVELRDAGAHRVGDPEHAQKPRRPDAMNTPARALRARNLRTLAGLAALFLLPLVMAFFTYYCTGWRPAGHVN